MRTTLSLDDDVAAKLKRMSKGSSFKAVVNEALRAGLHVMESQQPARKRHATRPVKGKPRVKNLDHVANVIADIENEDWR